MKLPTNDKNKKTPPKNTNFIGISKNVVIRTLLKFIPDNFKLTELRRLLHNATVQKGKETTEEGKNKVQAEIDDLNEAITNLTDIFKADAIKRSNKNKTK